MFVIDILKYKAKQLKKKISPPAPTGKIRRHDVQFFPIGSLAKLEVYWKSTKFGLGPAIILHVLDNFVMRFDCFGGTGGHAHFYVIEPQKGCESRLFLPEPTIAGQIDRALFELTTNLDYWLSRHRNPSVRCVRLDPKAVAAAIDRARTAMREYDRAIAAKSADLTDSADSPDSTGKAADRTSVSAFSGEA